jgi:hypothetical protein
VLPVRAARLHAVVPVSRVIARGTGWWIVHPELRHVPRIQLVLDALSAFYRSDPVE